MTNCQIPKLLPQSFLACPPSEQYIKQFMASGFASHGSSNSKRLEDNPARSHVVGRIQSGQRPNTQGKPIQSQVFSDRAGQLRGISSKDSGQKMPQISGRDNVVPPISLRSNSNKDGNILSSKVASARGGAIKASHDNRPHTSGVSGANAVSGSGIASMAQTTQVWVTKWVDYSSKYGLGYLLSDLSSGVFFNDSTKIVADNTNNQFYYYERKAVSQNEKQDVLSTYSFTNFPKEL